MRISANPFPGLEIDPLCAALRAAGDESRLRALALLSKGELAVGELALALDQSQPRVSRHMKVLTEAGLAERAPEGAWVFYRLPSAENGLRALTETLVASLDPNDSLLRADSERLARVRAQRARHAEAYFAANAADWDRVRALHLPDADIDAAIRAAAGEGPFAFMADVGCGTGRMLSLFAPLSRRAEGFDTSLQMLAVARGELAKLDHADVGVRQGSIYAPPLAPGQADLVTMHLVLHFLPDPRRAVIEAARLLRPGGRLVISDFAPHGLEFLRDRHAHRRLGFSDDEIAAWCEAAGAPVQFVRTLAPSASGQDKLTVKIWAATALGASARASAQAPEKETAS